jgi:hypothetical protein
VSVTIAYDPGKDQSRGAVAVVDVHRPPQLHPNEVPPDDPRSLAELLAPVRPTYLVRHLEYLPHEMPHPAAALEVLRIYHHPELPSPKTLIVDATGVGNALYDLLRPHAQLIGVVWHGGVHTTQQDNRFHVSKPAMVHHLLVLTEGAPKRLRFGPALPYLHEMYEEMRHYVRMQRPTTGYEIFRAGTTGVHDDLISALMMAVWWTERFAGRQVQQRSIHVY